MAIRHRTPLIALVLAPFALWALVLAWEHALLPLLSPAWRSGGVAPPSGEAPLERALKDPDAGVRQAAADAGQQWSSRKRAWPVDLWQHWRAGEYSKVAMTVLTAVTVAAPVLIGGVFFLYFMARLLTYAWQRRWRALVVVPVMAAWAAASYGMFLVYFTAGHIRIPDLWHALQVAGVLWVAVAIYAAAGWGLHYAVRR
ncbi:MAG: hypothetical protein HY322_17375 [Betaproteobacteria bacterium]|nr:hypothetical protein [Betaproteobacteria bacterium]